MFEDLTFSDEDLHTFSLTVLKELSLSDHPDWHNIEGWWVRLKLMELVPCTYNQSLVLFNRITELGLLEIAAAPVPGPVSGSAFIILNLYSHQKDVPDSLLEEWGKAKGYHPNWAKIYMRARRALRHAA